MRYRFPIIRTIDDVLPHIDDNFRVIEKDYGTFINYNVMGTDTFPDVSGELELTAAVRRECRGIMFSPEGKLVSRPFHKFFNVGEREETGFSNIDLKSKHTVYDKLDGSMIRPVPTPYGIRWGTKMGITDVALLAEEFVADKDNFYRLAEDMIYAGSTPIFEFMSRKSRIVVDYGADSMVLLAARDNISGEYYQDTAIYNIGKQYGVPVVPVISNIEYNNNPELLVNHIRSSNEIGEGIVVVFIDGHRVKIKTDEYVKAHRAKDSLRSDRALAEVILSGGLDDLIPLLQKEDVDKVWAYADKLNEYLLHLSDDILYLYDRVRESYPDKKSFAISDFAREELTPFEKSLMFLLWDGKEEDPSTAANNVLLKACSNNSRWQDFKDRVEGAAFLCNFCVEWNNEQEES